MYASGHTSFKVQLEASCGVPLNTLKAGVHMYEEKQCGESLHCVYSYYIRGLPKGSTRRRWGD